MDGEVCQKIEFTLPRPPLQLGTGEYLFNPF